MSDKYVVNSGEIKFLSIAKVNEAHLLISLASSSTKKAYSDEVVIYE